jgi:hypothetical protein
MCGEVSLSSRDPEPFVSVLLDLLLLGLVVPMWCLWLDCGSQSMPYVEQQVRALDREGVKQSRSQPR